MNNNSNWTGKTSRTLNEAFGAHCNESISTQHEPMKTSEKLFCCIVFAIGLALVVLMASGVV
jgi:hypothetical protein